MKNMLSYLVALSFVLGIASNTAAVAGDKCDKPCAKGEKKECKKMKCTKTKDGKKETIEKSEVKTTETEKSE